MCQKCVERGTFTQDELDQRILAGDLGVMPIIDLSEDDAVDQAKGLVSDLVKSGMPMSMAIECGAEFLASYYLATGKTPS